MTARFLGIAWSSQPCCGIYPAPLVDASILALGTRAGSVEFFRYVPVLPLFRRLNSLRYGHSDNSEGTVSLIGEVKLCENWITNIAWSPWIVQNENCIYFCTPMHSSLTSMFCRQVSTGLRHGRRRCSPHKYFSGASVTKRQWFCRYL